ncbi:hypothetical protein PTTG_31044, partial [Puccinia triticina 1-1 BBBD Race 1]
MPDQHPFAVAKPQRGEICPMANRFSNLASLARLSMTGARQQPEPEGEPTQTQQDPLIQQHGEEAQQPVHQQDSEETRQAEKGRNKPPKKTVPPTDRATRLTSKAPTGSNTPRDDHTIPEEGPLTNG